MPLLPPVFDGFRDNFDSIVKAPDRTADDQAAGWYTETEISEALDKSRSSANFRRWLKTLRSRPSTRVDVLGRARRVMVYSLPKTQTKQRAKTRRAGRPRRKKARIR